MGHWNCSSPNGTQISALRLALSTFATGFLFLCFPGAFPSLAGQQLQRIRRAAILDEAKLKGPSRSLLLVPAEQCLALSVPGTACLPACLTVSYCICISLLAFTPLTWENASLSICSGRAQFSVSGLAFLVWVEIKCVYTESQRGLNLGL